MRASQWAIRYGMNCYFVCPPPYLELRKVQAFRQWLLGLTAAMPLPEVVA